MYIMKKFVMGLVFGLVLAISFSVMANSKIVAQYFNPTITVDGHKVNLKSKPVTINGTTYLPMRDLAETLNYNVQYDASSKTIKLNKNSSGITKPPIKDLNYLTIPQLEKEGFTFTFDNKGLTIERNGVSMDINQSSLDNWKYYGSGAIKKYTTMVEIVYRDGNFEFQDTIFEDFK